MKRAYFFWLFPCLIATFLFSQSNPAQLINQGARVAPAGVVAPIAHADPKGQARILDQYGKLPLSFEANHGQTDARVKFLARTSEYSLFLTGDEAVLALSAKNARTNRTKMADSHRGLSSGAAEAKAGGVLRMKLRNANPAAKVTGVEELAGANNYFIGNDPAQWRATVPTYAKVKYEEIYSGVDLVYYGNQRQLEYDFIVTPGADPRRIGFEVSGARLIRRDGHGDLVLEMKDGQIRWHKPVAYQEKDGIRQEIAARYAIANNNRVEFELAKYDVRRSLYIDPLIYSTYLGGGVGGGEGDEGYGIAVDSAGNAYVTGATGAADFPVTPGAFQTACSASCAGSLTNAFVTKFNPAGSALVYSTYLGGSSFDGASAIAVDSAGNAYLTGETSSTDFPTTPGAFQTTYGGGGELGDAFVVKLNATGSALVYSTYLGGNDRDQGGGIALDADGNAYIAGSTASTNFPTKNPLQPTGGGPNIDAFVAKLNQTGSALVYSTYLGGTGLYGDFGNGIAVDSAGNAYVAGVTNSTDFPTKNPLQPASGGGSDAFVTKINAAGSALLYSTYVGGSESDGAGGIALDGAGNAYIAGAASSPDFPTTPGAFQTTCHACAAYYDDAFVAKINNTGSALVYSTFLGGSKSNAARGIAVDGAGNAYVAGGTTSSDFPTTPGVFQPKCGTGRRACIGGVAFVAKLNPAGSALVYSSYLNGQAQNSALAIAVDSSGNPYVAGETGSRFSLKNPFQPSYGGGPSDAFVAKIDMRPATATTLASAPNPSTYGQAVTFTAAVTSPAGAVPDGDTVSFMKGAKLLGAGVLSSGTASFTTSTLKVGTTRVKAVYSGDSSFAGSQSKGVKQVVNQD